MMKKILFLIFALFSILKLNAQVSCGTDKVNQQLMATDPAFLQSVASQKAKWIQHINSQNNNLIILSGTDTTYVIPLVLHIFHTGGALGSNYNPSQTQIDDFISTLNKIYSATEPTFPSTSAGGVDMKIQFVLAKVDSNCNSSAGINRIDLSGNASYVTTGAKHNGTTGLSDLTIKAMSNWGNQNYYNVWVVNKIDGFDGYSGGGVAGYAYFPGAGATVDGTVILAKYINGSPDDVNVFAHEFGHAMGLYHTFQGDNGGNSCPTETNCLTQNDEVCDTDPHIRSFNCPTGINACTGTGYNNVEHNIMNYTSCTERFTAGQKAKGRFNLATQRKNLIHSSAGNAPSTTFPISAACIPTLANSNTNNIGPRNVVFNTIGYQSSGYNGDGNKKYIDRSCYASTSVKIGQTYALEITTGGVYAQNIVAYIDYNNNGVFDTTEIVMNVNGNAGTFITSTNITIPNTATTCYPLRLRVMCDRTSNPITDPCALAYGQAEDFAVLVEKADTVGITLTSGTNPSCPGTSLTFTPTTNSTYSPLTYLWYVNNVYNSTGNTFTSSTLNDNDVVTVKLPVSASCGSSTLDTITSAAYTVSRQSNVGVVATNTIINGSSTLCLGSFVTLKAAITNSTATTYQWILNGTTNIGTGTDTLIYAPANSDQIHCIITAANPCFTGAKNTDTLTFTTVSSITPTSTIALQNATFPICAGTSVTFNATTTGEGTAPNYLWYINSNIAATGSTTFTTTSLMNGDTISFGLVSSESCKTDSFVLSNTIIADVLPVDTVNVSASVLQGALTFCPYDSVVLDATVINGGTTPMYQWYVNGSSTVTTQSTTLSGLATGTYSAFVTALSSLQCTANNPAVSNILTINVVPQPSTPVISLIGNTLTSTVSSGYQWYGPGGLIPGATNQTLIPSVSGLYYCVGTNGACEGEQSNKLLVFIVGNKVILESDLISVYPNPAKDMAIVELSSNKKISSVECSNILGQKIELNYSQKSPNAYQLNFSNIEFGIYYITVIDDKGQRYMTPLQLIK